MQRTFTLTAAITCFAFTMSSGQSLWNERHGVRTVFSDTTAHGIGDILTVVIDESNQVENDEESKLENQGSLSALISNFDIIPNFFNTLPRVEGQQSREFEGSAEYDKDNRFRTRLSVLVVDVLPNGNLLIEGTRRLFVDGETKIIKITGMVRRYDVTRDNTVRSESVADAAISYEGEGFMTRSTNRGWFSRMLDVVWPF